MASPFLAMPSSAIADPTADQYFLEELGARGIPRPNDADAINMAHDIVDLLIAKPTMDEVAVIGDVLLDGWGRRSTSNPECLELHEPTRTSVEQCP